jgi:hypothetical protein
MQELVADPTGWSATSIARPLTSAGTTHTSADARTSARSAHRAEESHISAAGFQLRSVTEQRPGMTEDSQYFSWEEVIRLVSGCAWESAPERT